MEKDGKNVYDRLVSLNGVVKAHHEDGKQQHQVQSDKLQSLEEMTAELENKTKKLDSRLIAYGAELKRSLNAIESEQIPSVVNPALE